MKRLYLVRHAKSSWEDAELPDFDRPLNKRGKKAAPKMGKRLKKQKARPDLIVSSPAVRAITTARVLAEALGYPLDSIVADDAVYHAGVDGLLAVVQGTDEAVESLMLFGHNPGFTDLARALTGDYIVNMPTCSVYCVDFDVDSWSKVSRGAGSCAFFDFPKSKP